MEALEPESFAYGKTQAHTANHPLYIGTSTPLRWATVQSPAIAHPTHTLVREVEDALPYVSYSTPYKNLLRSTADSIQFLPLPTSP